MKNVQFDILINRDISCLYSVSISIHPLKTIIIEKMNWNMHFRSQELTDHVKTRHGLHVQEIHFFTQISSCNVSSEKDSVN